MNEYQAQLRAVFLDEVRGDACAGVLAESQPDEDRREKLRTLQTVEARTVTTLRRLLDDARLHVDDRAARTEGRDLAAPLAGEDWDDLVAGLAATLPHREDSVTRLRDLSPRPTDPAFRALANHIGAIARFVEHEQAGQAKRSLKALTDYLRRPA